MKICKLLSKLMFLFLAFPVLARAQIYENCGTANLGTVSTLPAGMRFGCGNNTDNTYNGVSYQVGGPWQLSGAPNSLGPYSGFYVNVTFNPTPPVQSGTYNGSGNINYRCTCGGTLQIQLNFSVTYEFSATGYVSPKYVILGVTYAPPGPQSFVNYTSNTFVSNTSSLSSSFSNNATQSISVNSTSGILGWDSAKITASATNSVTQQSNTSSSVTVSKTTSQSNNTPGPSNAYLGVDHDYDYVWVWLNPLLLYTISGNSGNPNSPNTLQWNGYGYWTLDPAGFEVYGIWVGYLNGDFGPMPADVAQVFARTWAPNNADGSGPGLTTADFQNIMMADPYWQCGMASHPNCPTSVDLTRFTQTNNNTNIVYQQAPPGGQPGTQTGQQQYTTTSTQGQGAQYTLSQTFAVDLSFTSSWFIESFMYDLKESNTLTWVHQYNNTITNTNTETDSFSVTGPPCVVSGSSCNPLYTGSTEFDVYQDNLYGTFLFNPIN